MAQDNFSDGELLIQFPVFSVGCCKINIVEKMVSTFDYSHCKFFKNILYDSQGHKFIPGVATLKTGEE